MKRSNCMITAVAPCFVLVKNYLVEVTSNGRECTRSNTMS